MNNLVRNAEVYGFLKGNNSGFCHQESRQMMNATCTDYTFVAFSVYAKDNLVLHTEAGPCKHLQPHQTHLKLEFPWCNSYPIGFQRFEIGCRCDCHSKIKNYLKNCKSINQTSNIWISYINETDEKKRFPNPSPLSLGLLQTN